MANKRKSDKEIAQALRDAGGVVAAAAKKLGYTRNAVWQRCQNNPELLAIIQDAREGMCDIAEASLMQAVIKGKSWAVCFALKCLGKKRGYVERVEQDVTHHGSTELEITEVIVRTQQEAADLGLVPTADQLPAEPEKSAGLRGGPGSGQELSGSLRSADAGQTEWTVHGSCPNLSDAARREPS